MRKTFLLILGVIALLVVVALGIGVLVLLSEHKRFTTQLRQGDELFQKMQQEASRLEAEKVQLTRNYEALQNDAVSYVAQNTTLQEEAKDLHSRLTDAETLLRDQTNELQRLQRQLERLHREAARAKADKRKALSSAVTELNGKIASLEARLKQERAVHQYNLGVVYAQAERYDEAIEAYQQSLELDPKNADAYYNLGLLYERIEAQPEKAAWHYRKYLELNPTAQDREEVERWIDMLTAGVR